MPWGRWFRSPPIRSLRPLLSRAWEFVCCGSDVDIFCGCSMMLYEIVCYCYGMFVAILLWCLSYTVFLLRIQFCDADGCGTEPHDRFGTKMSQSQPWLINLWTFMIAKCIGNNRFWTNTFHWEFRLFPSHKKYRTFFSEQDLEQLLLSSRTPRRCFRSLQPVHCFQPPEENWKKKSRGVIGLSNFLDFLTCFFGYHVSQSSKVVLRDGLILWSGVFSRWIWTDFSPAFSGR